MKKAKLTKRFIAEVKDENGMIQDAECPTLVLRMSGKTKTFCFLKTHDYKQYRKAIGRADAITRDEAIARCNFFAGNLARFGSIDPDHAVTKPVPGITIGEAYQLYRKNREREQKIGIPWGIRLEPFKDRPISTITFEELDELHRTLSKTAPMSANNVVTYIRTIINFAIREELYDGKNPAVRVRLNPETSRQRYLSPSEAPRFIALMEEYRKHERTRDGAEALLLMLYTWQRHGNVVAMEWKEIDELNLWTIPAAKAKARKNIVVALTAEALEIINGRRGNKSPFVFPSRSDLKRHRRKCQGIWEKIRKECGLADCRIHDLRHTGATYALRSGADIATVSAALGHANIGITARVYAHVMTESKLEAARGAIDAMKNGGKG